MPFTSLLASASPTVLTLLLACNENIIGTGKRKRDASEPDTAGGRKRQRRGGDNDGDDSLPHAVGTRQSTRATKGKRKRGEDSEDDSQPNTYDYTDSFIDDDGVPK